MVPSDYRLDEVVARLISRLEGARRTFVTKEEARAAFERIAHEHVASAVAEYREMMPDERDRQRQEALLQTEVLDTFLPRYLRLSVAMNHSERGHFGVGKLGEPVGRAVLVGLVLVLLFPLIRLAAIPYMWPVIITLLSVPAWPDFIAAWSRRRYLAQLQGIIDDMQRIQQQATAYLPPEALDVEAPEVHRSRTQPPKEGEWRN